MEKLAAASAEDVSNILEETLTSLLREQRSTVSDRFVDVWTALRKAVVASISTTVDQARREKEGEEDTRDRLVRRRAELAEAKLSLEESRTRATRETENLRNDLRSLEEDIDNLRRIADGARADVDTRVARMVDAARVAHVETAQRSRKEVEVLRRSLEVMEEQHREEKAPLRRRANEIEKYHSELVRTCRDEIVAKEKAIESVRGKLDTERLERKKLTEYFKVVDRNMSIGNEEENILAEVKKMEEMAEGMLWHGAVQLQKLFRGKRDRAAVAKTVQKRRKGSKGKKKKGKGKKSKK